MTNTKLLITGLSLFSFTFLFSCSDDEQTTCSCTTTVVNADGLRISTVNSTQDTPASGLCSDLFSSVVDPAGNVTRTDCN